ncbi:MAG TPA: hypothetical protein PLE30_01025 [Candidatus Kapabacteria bacterium]|nr:hypothetical protein [Candidatus Kapabacteria bacterium]
MNNKKHNIWLSILVVCLVYLGLGQNATAATWYSQGAVTLGAIGNWNSASDGTGSALGAWVNTDKYVVEGTDVLTFAATTFDTLFIQSTGNHVTAAVTVNGVVSVQASCAPTSGGSLTINGALLVNSGAALNPAGSITCNNVIITDATMLIATGTTLDINGDLSLVGTSALTAADDGSVVSMTGASTQAISVADDSYCEFGDLTINGAGVTTASSFTLKDILTTTAGAFTASAGTVTFNPAVASVLWAATGAITFNDVILNLSNNGTPATSVVIKGDLTKIGASNFAPTAGTVTFTNTNLSGKTMQLVGGTNSFVNLAVSAGSKLTTSSDFTIGDPGTVATAAALSVASSASFICQTGTVSIVSNSATISNSGTLEFNNLTNAATGTATTTASDFTIKGNFTNAAAGVFSATAGTITFNNATQKTITNTNNTETEMMFWGLAIAASSDVTCANNVTIKSDLTLNSASELTFTAGEAHLDEATATIDIVVADNANLEFYDVIVGATEITVVNTADNFKVKGTVFTVTNNGAEKFEATDGTITFTAACVLTAGTNGDLIFNNITVDGAAVTDAAAQFVQIKGNLTLNNAGASYTSGAGSTVTFNGTANSVIGGSTNQDPVATFDVLVVNKTGTSGNDKVTLGDNVAVANTATSTITLTDGILDLSSYTLTVGANVLPTQGTGAINGSTGTYVISTGHNATGLIDAFFTIDGTPTLYNLTDLVAHTMGAGNLTVNNNFNFTGAVAFTIPASQTLEIKGNVVTTAAGTFVGANATSSILKLTGTGTCDDLQNALFGATPSITLERGETLTGALTLIAGNVLKLNNSTQFLDLSTYTLTLNNTTVLQRVSGGIDAEDGSVILGTHASHTTIPANLFKNNTVNNLTIAAATTLAGDLTVNGTLTGVFQITTNNNILTFGPSATLPAYVAGTHVVGNLKRTVTNTATAFPIGGGGATAFRPISLQFANAGSSQVVMVSSAKENPVYGNGGDPSRAILSNWTITPVGTAPADTVAIDFGWGTDHDNGLAVGATTTFPARWNTSSWADYRTGYATTASANFAANAELTPIAANFPVNANVLAGDWAIFVASAATDVAKDAAINVTNNKLVVKNITPATVEAGVPFTATIELQDQYGNATNVTGSVALTLAFADLLGTATYPAAVIPVGSSSVTIGGFSYASASAGNQFKVTGSGPSSLPTPGVSPLINVIGGLPSNQVNSIVLGGGTTSTSLDFTLTTDNGVILAKAGSAITSDDFPVDGQTYFASNNFGEGSKIGGAVVVYKGTDPASAITVNGLAPNTTYYFRGFSFGSAVTAGTEKYLTFAAANNPKSFTTSGTSNNDDDIDYGSNNTKETAKPIGANSPIKGTIKSATDEDWFSFTITNSSPNLRARLTLSAALGNYNVELYNADGRRIRRGTRLSNSTENQVINDLTPGTFLVRVVGVSGAFDASNYYTLQLTTDGTEIYSVTE